MLQKVFLWNTQTGHIITGSGEVFRTKHLIRLAESIKTKQSYSYFSKEQKKILKILFLCSSNQISSTDNNQR